MLYYFTGNTSVLSFAFFVDLLGVLLIALILLSVELHVYEVGKAIGEANPNSLSDSIFTVRLGSRHVVVGSLANISQGGANQNLETNLER